MNTPYTISNVQCVDDYIQSNVSLKVDHAVFDGHFPSKPILPGVHMLQILTDVLSAHLNINIVLQRASSMKFLNMWLPELYPSAVIEIYYSRSEKQELVVKNCSIFYNEIIFFKCKCVFREQN